MKEEHGRRGEDVEISFMGLTIKGTAKSITTLLSNTIGMVALVGVLLFHHFASDQNDKNIIDAIWVQTITLATPQEDRVRMLQQNSNKLPDKIKSKVDELRH